MRYVQHVRRCFLHSWFVLLVLLLFCQAGNEAQARSSRMPQASVQTDVLIIGGGASGVTAGIQAARLGVKVLIVEETPWLGGMLTAAGVSAIDGNNKLPSGLWGEFRQKLRDYYGGADKVETGWVSNTLFEPHVGDSIWKAMARAEDRFLTVWYGMTLVSVERKGRTVLGAALRNLASGERIVVRAKVTIDGTELGDVIARAGAKFDVGMESRAQTGEACAPKQGVPIIQDLTYVAILKDFRGSQPDADRRIPRPARYNPMEFNGCCRESALGVSADSAAKLVDAETMLNYGRLPTPEFVRTGLGAKYMLNWPRKGNDYYLNVINNSREERLRLYEEAKQVTLRFVYHIQTTLGFKHLGLADDEFPTPDSLALIPYHRESRRTRGVVRMTVHHILKPYDTELYKTAIAVGDYPIDHHHDKYPEPQRLPKIDFPPVPSFSIPLGCLIPSDIDGLIAAEKNISVSNIVNGTTRLQPCVMLIGQAAGALAALACKAGVEPRRVAVRSVQQILLESRCWLLPFLDVLPESPYFEAVQKIGVVGALRGTGVPYKWANQTWFYPDSAVHRTEFASALRASLPQVDPQRIQSIIDSLAQRYDQRSRSSDAVTVAEAWAMLEALQAAFYAVLPTRVQSVEALRQTTNLNTETASIGNIPLLRKDCAVMLHKAFAPFEHGITLTGSLLLPRTSGRAIR
jgi:hypothetical protein